MRLIRRIAIFLLDATSFAVCIFAGAAACKGVAYLMFPSPLLPSAEDQMVAYAIPSIFGMAVGAKVYYWIRPRSEIRLSSRSRQSSSK